MAWTSRSAVVMHLLVPVCFALLAGFAETVGIGSVALMLASSSSVTAAVVR